MSLIGNIIWIVFGGFIVSLGYILGGLSFIVTIIGIPFGMQSIKLGLAALAPFGTNVKQNENKNSLKTLFDIIWLILFGWEIALGHLLFGLLFAVTIIGLPFAKQHFKLIPVALLPFNKELK